MTVCVARPERAGRRRAGQRGHRALPGPAHRPHARPRPRSTPGALHVRGREPRERPDAGRAVPPLDADGECAFHYAQPSLTIEPAERVEVPLVVRPPRQIWIGRARDRQFEATARPLEGELHLCPQQGVYRQRSWLPWWLLVVAPLLVALAAAILLLLPKKTTVPDLTRASSRFAAEQALDEGAPQSRPARRDASRDPASPARSWRRPPPRGARPNRVRRSPSRWSSAAAQVVVPSVVGLKVQAAAVVLDKVGLKLGEMLPPPPDPQATIGSQIPAAGKKARPGDAIMLFVVHGAATAAGTGGTSGQQVALPKVAGLAPAAAAASLAKAGLLPTEVQRYDAAPPGTLVRSVPDAGAQLAKGASVAARRVRRLPAADLRHRGRAERRSTGRAARPRPPGNQPGRQRGHLERRRQPHRLPQRRQHHAGGARPAGHRPRPPRRAVPP